MVSNNESSVTCGKEVTVTYNRSKAMHRSTIDTRTKSNVTI